jgi:hypothetical protein
MTDELRERVFRVVPNGPSNMTRHVALCYFNHVLKQYVWVDDFHNVKKANDLPKDAKPFMLIIDKNNQAFTVRIQPGDPETKKQEELIKFFKEWPDVAQALPNGDVNSYPSDNHKRVFSVFHKEAPNAALDNNRQPLKYIDEQEQTKESAKEKRRKIEISTALNGLINDDKRLEQVLYLLGISPYGVDTDGKFNLLYDAVHEGDKGGRFLEIMQENKWENRLELAVSVAKTLNIISISNSGVYQFLGNPISKAEKEVPFYFRSHKHYLIELKHELQLKGQDFSDLEMDDDGQVVSAKEKGGKGKGGKAKDNSQIVESGEQA